MKIFLKVALWIIVIGVIMYLAFGRTKKEVTAPTPEMTGGVGGERAEMGENEGVEVQFSSDLSL
jgi:hypothetical protein